MNVSFASHKKAGPTRVALMCVSAYLAFAALMGCAVGPRYHSPAPPTVATYTAEPQPASTVSSPGSAGTAQQLKNGADIPAQWWTLFQSAELDRLVRQALDNSPTLKQASARLMQAQEEVNARSGATKYPSVSLDVSAQREQVNLAVFGVPFPSPPPFGLLNGSGAVSYALDLFGANRRLIESLNGQAEFQNWQLERPPLMLSGNVVSAAIRQAQLRSQIDLTHELLTLQERQLGIIERRVTAGGLAAYNVSQQRTLVEQARALLPPLEQQLDIVNHQLAVLVGKSPAEAHIEPIDLDKLHLPEELPVSLPSSLVRQRPDIRAAEALMHQASANVGVATANLYPQITLTGSFGRVGTTLSDLTSVWALGAGLTQPIFNGGTLRARQRASQDAYEAALASYRQTVLQGLQQVANALRALEHDAAELDARERAQRDAARAARIARLRHDSGGVSVLVLLDAQRQELQTALER